MKINLQKKNHFSGFSFYHWAVRLLVSVIIICYHFLTTCYVLHTSQNITNLWYTESRASFEPDTLGRTLLLSIPQLVALSQKLFFLCLNFPSFITTIHIRVDRHLRFHISYMKQDKKSLLMVNLGNECSPIKTKTFQSRLHLTLEFQEKWKSFPFFISTSYFLASKYMFMIIHTRCFNSHSIVQ